MSYFLRKTKKNGDLYLQICETTYNKETKRSSNKNYQVLGYLSELKKKCDDPVAHYAGVVSELNRRLKEEREEKVTADSHVTQNIGYFLIKAMLNTLNVKGELDVMGLGHKYEKGISSFIEAMMYCQIVKPSSKLKNAQDVLPSLLGVERFSDDQIYRMINFVGSNYKKYIELFNAHIDEAYPRDYKHVFFDCTNFYFEIDLPKGDRQKGPSKENRKEPIIGQALLLDGNQIPLGMEMFPGNESEKKYIRKLIEEMKSKANVEGRTIQVADKGLNCARNIYAAAKEAGDGYVFSKSVHGKLLSEKERKWVLLSDDGENRWTDVCTAAGEVKYRYKSCVDVFDYEFVDENGSKTAFRQREKRVVSYNPELAKKQILEINRQLEKIRKLSTVRGIKREEYGDSVKYVKFESDVEGANVKAVLNEEKIREDKLLAGYNLIVTSETKLDAREIYEIYHGLWRIEESFRITKSYLEARPVYLQTKESIYGHFLICYLALTTLRLIEFNVFGNELNSSELVGFIRSFNITKYGNRYISNIKDSRVLQTIKRVTGITSIDNLYFDDRKIQNLLEYEF